MNINGHLFVVIKKMLYNDRKYILIHIFADSSALQAPVEIAPGALYFRRRVLLRDIDNNTMGRRDA